MAEHIDIQNLDDNPIDFNLSSEDLAAIQGGGNAVSPLPTGDSTIFPVRIYPAPPDDSILNPTPPPKRRKKYQWWHFPIRIQARPQDRSNRL
jgi:hypothetical protein